MEESFRSGNCQYCGAPMWHPQVSHCGDSYCSELYHVEQILLGRCSRSYKTAANKAHYKQRREELIQIIEARRQRESGENGL